jgi:hypothetical protein
MVGTNNCWRDYLGGKIDGWVLMVMEAPNYLDITLAQLDGFRPAHGLWGELITELEIPSRTEINPSYPRPNP